MRQRDTKLSTDRLRGRQGLQRTQLQAEFIKTFEQIGFVIHTCKQIGIEYSTWCDWMKDPVFQDQFSLVNKKVLEKYEVALAQRAINGVDDPIYQGGKLVGYRKQYSDDLLKLALRVRDPEKYREVVKHDFDEKLSHQLASEFVKAIRHALPTHCPGCKTDLRLSDKIAEQLKTLSGKLNMVKK